MNANTLARALFALERARRRLRLETPEDENIWGECWDSAREIGMELRKLNIEIDTKTGGAGDANAIQP